MVNQSLPDRNPFFLCLFTTLSDLSEPKLKSLNKLNRERKEELLFQYKTTQEKSAKSFFLCRSNRRLERQVILPKSICFFSFFPPLPLFLYFIYMFIEYYSICICNKRQKSVLQNNINSKKREQKDLKDFWIIQNFIVKKSTNFILNNLWT